MCHKCDGSGFISEHPGGDVKLTRPCPVCNRIEDVRSRPARKLPTWIKSLSERRE